MSVKTEGENPFDRYLPPEKRQVADGLGADRSFEEVQDENERITREAFELSEMAQAEQNRLDDKRFRRITSYSDLLQFTNHDEYLRARRSLDRRLKHAKETGERLPEPWTGPRIWAVATLIVAVFLVLCALKESLVGGFIVACFILPIWAVVAKIPSFLAGLGGGQYGRGGGNAV